MHPYEFILDDMTFSFSSLSTYDRCPYNFLLNYILKKDNEQNGFAQYGTFCHELLERYAKGELMVFELYNEYIDNFYNNVTLKFPRNKYKDIGVGYYEDGLSYFENFEGFDGYNILDVEKKVTFNLNGHKSIGFIDLLVRNKNGKIEIVDHKSKDLKKPQKKRWENIDVRYTTELYHYLRQLYLYSIPVIEEFGEYPEYLNFNCFRKQKWFKIPFDIDDYKESKNWAIKTIDNIYKDIDMTKRYESPYFCNNICGNRRSCDYSDRYEFEY